MLSINSRNILLHIINVKQYSIMRSYPLHFLFLYILQYYIIKSKLTGLVLDVEGGGRNIGARVITWDRSGADNQIWYDDPATGTIRSKASQYCLDIESK